MNAQKKALQFLKGHERSELLTLGKFDTRRSLQFGVLETERIALGVSQKEMARRMKIRAQSYQNLRKRLQRGGETVKVSTIRTAARALGCTAVVVLVPVDEKTFALLAQREEEKLSLRKKAWIEQSKEAGRRLGGRKEY